MSNEKICKVVIYIFIYLSSYYSQKKYSLFERIWFFFLEVQSSAFFGIIHPRYRGYFLRYCMFFTSKTAGRFLTRNMTFYFLPVQCINVYVCCVSICTLRGISMIFYNNIKNALDYDVSIYFWYGYFRRENFLCLLFLMFFVVSEIDVSVFSYGICSYLFISDSSALRRERTFMEFIIFTLSGT